MVLQRGPENHNDSVKTKNQYAKEIDPEASGKASGGVDVHDLVKSEPGPEHRFKH